MAGTRWATAWLGWMIACGPQDPAATGEDADGDGFPASVDCDDGDASVFPNADDPAGDGLDQDCDGADAGDPLVDADLDGYGASVDCDDGDSTVHPAAPEVLEDGIDQDCDGADAIGDGSDDEDHDGYTTATDCDDLDPSAYPGAPELAGDGTDQDCDGVDTTPLSDLGVGDLLLSEVMNDPLTADDAWGEWIELYNATPLPVDLAGLEVAAELAEMTFTVDRSVQVAANGYVVLVRDADSVVNGGVVGQFDYRSDLGLSNDVETLSLSLAGVVFDQVAFDDANFFPDSDGGAMSLDPGHLDRADNDEGQFWCVATAVYGAGDLGTPGAENSACAGLGDGDGDGWVAAHDCDDADADVHPLAAEVGFDGLDADCDGADARAEDLGVGDLVITEIMTNPDLVSDADGEWFELLNAASSSVNLRGMVVDDGAGLESFTVDVDVVVQAGAYAVFAADVDDVDNGGVVGAAFDVPGSQFELANSVDAIALRVGGTLIDAVAYDGGVQFPDPTGASLSLDSGRTAANNDQGGSWCVATARIVPADPLSDLGTPGRANGQCP